MSQEQRDKTQDVSIKTLDKEARAKTLETCPDMIIVKSYILNLMS